MPGAVRLSVSAAHERHREPRVASQAEVDPRVAMVLDVLAGAYVDDVAHEWSIEPSLLHRWVRDFLVAGTAAVTNRPDPDSAPQRDRLLAAFAHELRTPLAIAHGWAGVLADGDVPEDMAADALERMSGALERLSERVLDIELTASTSLGLVRFTREPVDVAELCRGIEGSPVVRRGEGIRVLADPRLLSRIVRDLWLTAHRDPAPDRVSIDVLEADAWHEIRVVREGSAISPMVIKALLDPFDANDDATGVTMGLYLARALLVAQGGFLGAEGDDDVTVLYARLPREGGATQTADGPEGTARDKGGKP